MKLHHACMALFVSVVIAGVMPSYIEKTNGSISLTLFIIGFSAGVYSLMFLAFIVKEAFKQQEVDLIQ